MQRVGAILVLEHDRASGDMIGEILSAEGYSVSTFLDVASSRALPAPLILLDAADQLERTDMTVRTERTVQQNTFWLGSEEQGAPAHG